MATATINRRTYVYYIEPRGNVAFSNEVLGKNLGEENARGEILCADGKKRNLWFCPSAQVIQIWNSRRTLHIEIGIFCQEGAGQIREITKSPMFNPKKRFRSKAKKAK